MTTQDNHKKKLQRLGFFFVTFLNFIKVQIKSMATMEGIYRELHSTNK